MPTFSLFMPIFFLTYAYVFIKIYLYFEVHYAFLREKESCLKIDLRQLRFLNQKFIKLFSGTK